MRSRIVIIFIGIILAFGMLVSRAMFLQVFPNEKLAQLEKRKYQTVIQLAGKRGTVTDRKGNELAISAPAYSLYADPSALTGKKKLAKRLAKELGHYGPTVFSKIKDSKRKFVWIARQLPMNKYETIKGWQVRGLGFVEEPRRVYPNTELAAQILGIVGTEGRGLEGLELKYDQVLRGNPKKLTVRRDARGRTLSPDSLLFGESPDGADLQLTLDRELQYFVEGELQRALVAHEAESAIAVVLDAQTSAILAMASAPTFNLEEGEKVLPAHRRNRAVTDAFEPGSTMKTFVVAGALREKLLKPNSKYFCENGSYKVGKRIIREADSNHSWGSITVSEILAYSSNIGTTKIAMQLGPENLRRTLLDFGFGSRLGIDLPGEANGILQALPWHDHLLSNVSFGHGIAVTPLQIANAYATIANGGILRQPYVVKSIFNYDSEESVVTEPKDIRRVLTTDEAEKMRLLLAGVTSPGGTAVNAKVPGFMVAGKTGTAQKVNPTGRGYLPGAYISSFAGMIPTSEPKFVIYVAVDSPKKQYYGSQVAAPLFSRIASYAVRNEGLAPALLTNQEIISQESQSAVKNEEKTMQNLSVDDLREKSIKQTAEVVPDLMNLTAREVLRKVRGVDVQVNLRGSGVVAEMDPAPGSPIPNSKQIQVFLK